MSATATTRVRFRATDETARAFLDSLSAFDLVAHDPDVVVADPTDEVTTTTAPLVHGPSEDAGGDAHARLAAAVRDAAGHAPIPYPTPNDEDARLAAARRYDTTDATLNAHLDALSVAIRASLGARSSIIGIVDADTEYFLARDGIDVSEIPRSSAACAYGVLADDPLVIEDASRDVRSALDTLDFPIEPRSYAGAPIRTPDGHAVGMVCVVHDEPRTFDERETNALSWFADEVVRHLEDHGR